MIFHPVLRCCPFCGGRAAFQFSPDGENMGGHFVACNNCDSSSRVIFAEKCNPAKQLAELWNRRENTDTKNGPCPKCGDLQIWCIEEMHVQTKLGRAKETSWQCTGCGHITTQREIL